MARGLWRWRLVLLGVLAIVAGVQNFELLPALAADKVRIASSVKVSPRYYLTPMAAEEKGFWKQNGLEVEFIYMAGGGPFARALAAGALDLGFSIAVADIHAASAGIPLVIVAELDRTDDFFVWVRTDGRVRRPADLKGAAFGINNFGGIQHAYARMLAKALGIERDMKIVATGGIAETMAALKTGVIDALVLTLTTMIELKIKGEVRELVAMTDYLPKDWFSHSVVARREFLKSNPDGVRRSLKAIFLAVDFIKKNPAWTVEKMRKENAFSEKAARQIYDLLAPNLAQTARVNKKGLEGVKNFLIEYAIVPKDKAPNIDDISTEEFTR